MLEHHLYSTLAAAESGIERKAYKHIQESYHIVEDNSSGVAGNKVCTVCCHQRGKEAEKSERTDSGVKRTYNFELFE